MHNYLKKFSSSLSAILLLCTLLSACKKQDKFPAQSLPEITSINPNSAIPGSTIEVKGKNLNPVMAIRFGIINALFQTPGDTSIVIAVPDSLAPGKVYIQVYVGDGVAYAAKEFTVLPAPKIPRIAGIHPNSAAPGDTIIITGKNFTAVNAVSFNTTKSVYIIDDSSRLIVTVPGDVSGTNQLITVASPTGSDTASFMVNFAPQIASFTPQTARAGDMITVLGKQFSGTSSLKINNTATVFNVVNDTMITFTIPPGATSGLIQVTTAKGTATSVAPLTVTQ